MRKPGFDRHSSEWPPPLPKDHPTALDWRVSRLEQTIDRHSDHIEELHESPVHKVAHALPWLRIIGLCGLLVLGLGGHLSPEQIRAILLRMVGL